MAASNRRMGLSLQVRREGEATTRVLNDARQCRRGGGIGQPAKSGAYRRFLDAAAIVRGKRARRLRSRPSPCAVGHKEARHEAGLPGLAVRAANGPRLPLSSER
ncbi:hypothetical protein [Lysobacter gummosus]|uniref:hypothetical protein n=1 Tax=Lysobacter gummosus TaxID=262324 RepID=UPI00363D4D51